MEEFLAVLEQAPGVARGFEIRFDSEVRRAPAKAAPNSFQVSASGGTTMGAGPAKRRRWESWDLFAYDGAGEPVGVFSILTKHPDCDAVGAFKISVRENARRQGWGFRLLDEAARRGIDIAGSLSANRFSNDGRALLAAWLRRRASAVTLPS